MNIVLFIPYGVYISILKDEWNLLKKAVPAFLTGLSYETLRYVFAIGDTDITDLFGNTPGGLLGIALFWILSKVLKDHTIKAVYLPDFIGMVFITGLPGVLFIANL